MLTHSKTLFVLLVAFATIAVSQLSLTAQTTNPGLTALQSAIETQRQRLSSSEVEERRDALMRLRALRHPLASRAAVSALNDAAPIVRVTAAASVLSLPAEESAAVLIPLLGDKEEFVRQHAAYALGHTRSKAAVGPLVERLGDKKDSVRAAAVVALGEIGDATALTSLTDILSPSGSAGQAKKSKAKREKNAFVLRAAAHSLGEIGNRAALPALLSVVQDEKAEVDVRREVVYALGAIGDSSALPALRGLVASTDPYLAQAASDAIHKLSK
ncbi:MAG TPA: HEAT repeat domain-containing protein [Pyrinomonadaceae bacterium]|nr:HEAT repeat domain-containing protein [Pyrinomonadaceae bacterium]